MIQRGAHLLVLLVVDLVREGEAIVAVAAEVVVIVTVGAEVQGLVMSFVLVFIFTFLEFPLNA